MSSSIEQQFMTRLINRGLPLPKQQYYFKPWHFDFAYPDIKLAIEVESDVWMNGHHTKSYDYLRDIKKYNAAALAGWKVLRFTKSMILDYSAFDVIQRALAQEGTNNAGEGEAKQVTLLT